MGKNEAKNNWQKNQSESSPFVVDLRQSVIKLEKEIIKDEKIIKKELKKSIKNFKLDLAKNKFPKKKYSFSLFKNKPSTLKDIFKIKISLKQYLKLKFRKRGPSLSSLIYNKEDIFIKALKNKIKGAKTNDALILAQKKTAWYRSVLIFFFVLCLLIAPLKILAYFDFFNLKNLETKILNNSQLALSSLMAAGSSVSKMDFKGADSNFQSASLNFLAAQEELNLINDSILSLASFSSDPKIKLVSESKNFLQAGTVASSLGRNLVLATDSLFSGNDNFTVALDQFLAYGQAAVNDATKLKIILEKINVNNLPLEYRTKFSSLNSQAILLSDSLANFVDAGKKLKEALGLSRDKRYLLVFQNNSELRASGGFLGSYALVDFRDGKIRNLEVPGGGSYDTEGGLNLRIVAPQPLWLLDPLWHFWDANWWPDWPKTAKNLMWFYEKSGGPSVDGVISITPTVIERLLEITGPIDLTKEYGLVIDASNFWENTQKIVEQKNLAKIFPEYVSGLATTSPVVKAGLPLKQDLENNANNKPKKIIGDLMVKILEVLPQKINKDNLINLISLLELNLSEKQLMFYFTDDKAQSAVTSRNWAGEIRETDKDYLMIVNTNIGGQKTDRKIVEEVNHSSEVSSDGTIINTVKIIRNHTGIKNEPLVGVRNTSWLRLYVPYGSELISASGFISPDPELLQERPEDSWQKSSLLVNEETALMDQETGTKIYAENGKTVFANWTIVDPGGSTEIIIKYRLPFNLFAKKISNSWLTRINKFLNPDQKELISYSLLLQKQAGAKPDNFSSQLILPAGLNTFWHYPEDLEMKAGWGINTTVDGDKFWSLLLNKE